MCEKMMPEVSDLYEVVDHTWPANRKISRVHWTLSQEPDGEKRVTAATSRVKKDIPDICVAEKGMFELDQNPLFMIREGDNKLDQILDEGAYKVIDAVNIYCISCEELSHPAPPMLSAFDIWEPLEIQKDIWAQHGTDRNRFAIMERAECIKTSLLMRCESHPAGAAYIGIYNGIAMVHALEILPSQRRKGVGAIALRQAAIWAIAQNAPFISGICTKENKAANALYASLKMRLMGGYNYRIKEETI